MIAEKSLELNVCENIINRIRTLGKDFSKAFLYGFTLRQESQHGLDVSINLPRTSKFLFALQYKAPKRKRNNKYVFEINNNTKKDQHIRLLITALWVNGEVYYTFPLFINTDELSQNSPNFLLRTHFAKILDFPPHTFDRNKHTVEIVAQSGIAYVSSDTEEKIKIYSANEFFKELENRYDRLENVGKLIEKRLTEEYVVKILKEKGFQRENIESVLEVLRHLRRHYVRHSFWL